MNNGTALLLLASLPILATILIEPLATPEARQEDTQAMSARDLYAERADPPPGLKCRVLMLDAAGDFAPVRPDFIFHSRDHIRLEFESNVPGYLYLLQRGSDTTWNVLFPSAEIHDNSNRLQPGRPLEFPRDADFYFDETPGEERIYAVLALKPQPDLERLLNVVRNGQMASGDGRLAELFEQISKTVSAELQSRNLRVSTESAGGAQSATYAVNTAPGQERVILELALNHQK